MGGRKVRHEKPELSKRNPYYLPRHRYYELKHFCAQYGDWKKALLLLDGWKSGGDLNSSIRGNLPSDPTEQEALLRAYYSQKIKMVEDCIAQVEPAVAPFLKMGVTEGLSYNHLRARGCPCGSEMYYDIYRRFFWILHKARG